MEQYGWGEEDAVLPPDEGGEPELTGVKQAGDVGAGSIVMGREVVVADGSDPEARRQQLDRTIENVMEEMIKEGYWHGSGTLYVNNLQRGGITTLRDLLVAGRDYVGYIPRSGRGTQNVADRIITASGLEEEWRHAEPTIEDIVGWCDDLSQVSDLVIWRHRRLMAYAALNEHPSVEQLWEDEAGDNYVGDQYILERLLDAEKMAGMTDERRSRLVWEVKYEAGVFAREFFHAKAQPPSMSS